MTDTRMTAEGLKAFMARTAYNRPHLLIKALGIGTSAYRNWSQSRCAIPHKAALAMAALAYDLPPYEGTVADYMEAHGYKFAVQLAAVLKTDREVTKRMQKGLAEPSHLERLALAALAANLRPME